MAEVQAYGAVWSAFFYAKAGARAVAGIIGLQDEQTGSLKEIYADFSFALSRFKALRD